MPNTKSLALIEKTRDNICKWINGRIGIIFQGINRYFIFTKGKDPIGVQSIRFYCCFCFCYHEGLVLAYEKMMFKTNILFTINNMKAKKVQNFSNYFLALYRRMCLISETNFHFLFTNLLAILCEAMYPHSIRII